MGSKSFKIDYTTISLLKNLIGEGYGDLTIEATLDILEDYLDEKPLKSFRNKRKKTRNKNNEDDDDEDRIFRDEEEL